MEQERRRIATVEFETVSSELEKYRAQDRADLQQLELRRSGEFLAAKTVHKEALARVEETHQLELAGLQAKHEDEKASLDLAQARQKSKFEQALRAARIEHGRLTAEIARLREHRNSVLQLVARYRAERDEARERTRELQVQRSAATVANRGPVLRFGEQ